MELIPKELKQLFLKFHHKKIIAPIINNTMMAIYCHISKK